MPKVHNVWDHPPLHGEEPCEIGSWDFHPDKERTDASVWKQDVVETPCGKRDSWDSETDLAPSESSFGEQSEGASTHWEDGSDGEQGRSAEIGPGVRQGSAESVSSNAWTSLSCLDGSWVGRGEMQGGSLRWYHDGPSVSVTVVGRNTIELHLDGCSHRGELQADGRLYWEDGDIWTRDTIEHASQPCVAAGFGFRLHSEVHVLGGRSESPTSEPGLVVGFTDSQVEVKHTDRIRRYFPCNLKSAAAEQVYQKSAANSRRPVSETVMQPQDQHSKPASKNGASRASSGAARAPCEQVHNCTVSSRPGVDWAKRLQQQSSKPGRTSDKSRAAVDASLKSAAGTGRTLAEVVKSKSESSFSSATATGLRHHGVVNFSRGSMAWVHCKSLEARFPDQDIFLHKSECMGGMMPRQHDRISFFLMQDAAGNPQARQAIAENPAPRREMVSAQDWFEERAKLRASKLL